MVEPAAVGSDECVDEGPEDAVVSIDRSGFRLIAAVKLEARKIEILVAVTSVNVRVTTAK
jgi:hypothetical protein